jgi:hypothetical protein
MLPFFVFVTLQPRRSCDFSLGLTHISTCLRPNSHGIISFTDPHPLTLLESHRFKKGVGRGSISIHSRFSISHSPYSLPSSVFSNPCICHSYGNTGGRGGILPTLELTPHQSRKKRPFPFMHLRESILQLLCFQIHACNGGYPPSRCKPGHDVSCPYAQWKGKNNGRPEGRASMWLTCGAEAGGNASH